MDLSSLETVSPNPTIVNYGDEGSASDLSSIASIASSWGATIADIASGNSYQQSPTYVVQSRAATTPATSGTSTILLLVVAAAVVYMIVRK